MTDVLDMEYGPAFAGLTLKQKKFVLAAVSNPFGQHQEWARDAGFVDPGGGKSNIRVRAHEAWHNPAVRAAMFEVSRAHMLALGPALALRGLIAVAGDPSHRDYLKACESLANRTGLHETTEHRVMVNHHDETGEALVARLKALAKKHGLDYDALINRAGAKLIEIEAQPAVIGDGPLAAGDLERIEDANAEAQLVRIDTPPDYQPK
jgi:hypothetical protein